MMIYPDEGHAMVDPKHTADIGRCCVSLNFPFRAARAGNHPVDIPDTRSG
jgi:hypothetical protein